MSISGFRKWLSELFCSHIWKSVNALSLNTSHTDYDFYPPIKFYHYAVEQKCVKCGKERIIQQNSRS